MRGKDVAPKRPEGSNKKAYAKNTSPSARRKGVENVRNTHWEKETGTHALDHPEGDHAGHIPGQCAKHRSKCEQGHAGKVEAFRAHGSTNPPYRGHQHNHGQQEGSLHPLDALNVRRKFSHHPRHQEIDQTNTAGECGNRSEIYGDDHQPGTRVENGCILRGCGVSGQPPSPVL